MRAWSAARRKLAMETPGSRLVLKREEDAGPRALVGFLIEDRNAVQQHVTAGDGVVGMAGDRFRQRRFAGAIGPHDRVDFAAVDDSERP